MLVHCCLKAKLSRPDLKGITEASIVGSICLFSCNYLFCNLQCMLFPGDESQCGVVPKKNDR